MTLRTFLTTLAFTPLLSVPMRGQTKVSQAAFGAMPDGAAVTEYTLADPQLQIKIISYGAHISSVMAPDRDGKRADVVLGYGSIDGYLADTSTYMGAVVGRYGNRIAKGKFTLEGKQYQVPVNNNGNALHGGTVGFDRKNWTGKTIPNGVELTLVSPDGDMGFPGTLTVHVRYTLAADTLKIEYMAATDKPTVVNLTNHTYFNLAGEGDVLATKLMIAADRITPVDPTLIPTGSSMNVAGSAFDFTQATPIGARIDSDDPQMKIGGGYDHNFVLKVASGFPDDLHLAAEAVDPGSGRKLVVRTTEPGVQFYSGNSLDGTYKGRSGDFYRKHDGFCLETQHFPDSPNQPGFPTTELKPGKTLRSTTTFTFETDGTMPVK